MILNSTIQSYNQLYTNFSMISRNERIINGKTSEKFVYTYNQNETNFKMRIKTVVILGENYSIFMMCGGLSL